MRVSSLYNSDAMQSQLNVNGSRLIKLMEQMSTLKRVNVPSDDPVAATRMVQLNREQAAIKQYQKNITALSGSLAIQESHVSAMSNQLLALNDKLLVAANSTHNSSDMAGFGNELSSMLDSLVASVNAQNESGGYVFSGTKTNAQPIVWDEEKGVYLYQGNHGVRETTVANGVNITENTNVVQAFSSEGDDLALLNKLKDLSEKMKNPDIPSTEYQSEIDDVLALSSTSRDKVAALFTELGGRQNRLTMVGDAHVDVSMANERVISDLSDTDLATSSINLQLYVNSVQITNKAYSMINELSLFSML
ncbi:flagellar hook-associated protein FlgL [Pantoea sp. OXWO6B1]|uniref:flagellar hook-associated protein FlgL n=1 Tax=Pantoea sp. OXWO6B1 TaxID=1835724 RepID=UPI0007C69279|nr:flagellar hook-associated protein FlgL [Pantoea sp. OXWO6B1]